MYLILKVLNYTALVRVCIYGSEMRHNEISDIEIVTLHHDIKGSLSASC